MYSEIKFINDKVVKKILNSEKKENREYLIRIISEITKIDIDLLRDNLNMVTNEVSSNINSVDSKVDAIYRGNNEYINIEINYNYNKLVTVKNNIYLYNMIIRQVKNKKDYKNVVPAIQININGYDLFKKGEFLYKSQMIETNYKIVRDELLLIYDINLEYLRRIDYNKFKKGNNYDLEKLLYIFICDNRYLLDRVYSGDKVMEKVREDLDVYVNQLDEMLYYDPDELNKWAREDEVKEEAEKRAKEMAPIMAKEMAKDMAKDIAKDMAKDIAKDIAKEMVKDIVPNISKEQIKKLIDKGIEKDFILNNFNVDKKDLDEIK